MSSRGEDQWNAHFLITVDHNSNTKIDKEGVSALLRQVAEETLGDPADVNPLTNEDLLTALQRD